MPSPFPGMDPYLENPATWGNFHANIIVDLQGALNERIRPKYMVRVEERVYVSDEGDWDQERVPDVRVLERTPGVAHQPAQAMAATQPIRMPTIIEEEVRERYLAIFDSLSKQLVTIIEVLSPANKARESAGHESFRAKRSEVMTSPVNWVEIDLLRQGQRFLPARRRPPGDYFVHSSKVGLRPDGLVWPVLLPEVLPTIAIPLKAEDEDCPLALQPLLDRIYDRTAYEDVVDYHQEPVPALAAHYVAWADELLKEKGLR